MKQYLEMLGYSKPLYNLLFPQTKGKKRVIDDIEASSWVGSVCGLKKIDSLILDILSLSYIWDIQIGISRRQLETQT